MLQVATGIAYLHENQIVHRFALFLIVFCVVATGVTDSLYRDLKLENALLKNDNGQEVVRLSDFGLSRFFSFQKEMTTSIGTEPYMSPEQVCQIVYELARSLTLTCV